MADPTWESTTSIEPTWEDTTPSTLVETLNERAAPEMTIPGVPKPAIDVLANAQLPEQFRLPATPFPTKPEEFGVPTTDLARSAQSIIGLGGTPPEITEGGIKLPKFTVNKNDSVPVAVGKEVVNLLAGLPEFFTTDTGMLAVLADQTPIGAAATRGYFTWDMLKSFKEQLDQYKQERDQLTPAERAQRLTQMLGTGAMAAFLGAKTVRSGLDVASIKSPTLAINRDIELGRGLLTLPEQLSKTAGKTLGDVLKESEKAPLSPLESTGTLTRREGPAMQVGLVPTAAEPFLRPEVQQAAGEALQEAQKPVSNLQPWGQLTAEGRLRQAVEKPVVPQPKPTYPRTGPLEVPAAEPIVENLRVQPTESVRARIERPAITEKDLAKLPETELNKVTHTVGMDYGATLPDADLPRIQQKFADAQKAMSDAIKAKDPQAVYRAFAENNFYGGALQVLSRGTEGPRGNFEQWAKDRRAEGLPVPGETRAAVESRYGGFDVTEADPTTGKNIGRLQIDFTGDGRATVKAVDVAEGHLRRGFGTRLYEQAKQVLEDSGITTLTGSLEGSGPVQIREKVFGPGNTKYFHGGKEISTAEAIKIMDKDFGYVRAETTIKPNTGEVQGAVSAFETPAYKKAAAETATYVRDALQRPEYSHLSAGTDVVDSLDQLPPNIRRNLEANMGEDAKFLVAFYDLDSGKVIFNASHPRLVGAPAEALRDLMVHEVSIHRGLRVAFGENRFRQLSTQIYHTLKPDEIKQLLGKGYQGRADVIGEEWLAHAAERVARTGIQSTAWTKVVGYIRQMYRDWTGQDLKFTDQEIANLIARGTKGAERFSSEFREANQAAITDVTQTGGRYMLDKVTMEEMQRRIDAKDAASKIYSDALALQKKIDAEPTFMRRNAAKKWLENNSGGYKKSVDPDLLCQKSAQADVALKFMKDTLGDQYNTDMAWELLRRAEDEGLEVMCYQCYLWAARTKTGTAMQKPVTPGIGGYKFDVTERVGGKTKEYLRTYGLRHYSSTDAKVEHFPGLMTEFVDLVKEKIPAVGYTKDLNFVDFVGPTESSFNISVGRDKRVSVQDLERAKALRQKHKNIGTVYISFTDAETLKALEQDWVDHGIPWHGSGQARDMMASRLNDPDVIDYTREQNEVRLKDMTVDEFMKLEVDEMRKVLGNKKRVAKSDDPIRDVDHGGSMQKYLALAKERNVVPKFPTLLKMLRQRGTAENYMKLIGPEYGKHGSFPYQPPKLEFGMEHLDRILEERRQFIEGQSSTWNRLSKQITKEVQKGEFEPSPVDVPVGEEGSPIKYENLVTPPSQTFRKTKAEFLAEGEVRGAISKSEELMSPEALQSANRSARATGAVGARAVTPRYVANTGRAGDTVLNFGSGVPDKTGNIPHSLALEEMGMRVTNHDVGANAKYADPGALDKQYDTVFASNVMNKLPNRAVANQVLAEMAQSVDYRGRAVFNFPASPRDLPVSPGELITMAREHFNDVRIVGGNAREPVIEARGPIMTGEIRGAISRPGLEDEYKIFHPSVKPGTTLKQKAVNAVEAFRTGISSKFRPANRLAEEIAKHYGLGKPRDVAGILEQLKGASGKGEADIYRFDRDVTQLIRKNESDFNVYMFLRRTLDRLQQDVATGQTRRQVAGYTIPEVQRKLRLLESQLGPDVLGRFQEAANRYQAYMDKALLLQVESGRMSQEVYNAIKAGNQFYTPFKVMKYIEEGMKPQGLGKKIDTVAEYTKAMEGIEDKGLKLGGVMPAARQNLMLSRVLAEKTKAMQEFAKLAAQDPQGLFIKRMLPGQEPPKGWETMNVFENGQVVKYATDPSVVQAVQLFGPVSNSMISKALQMIAIPFKTGATMLNLPFQASNLLADVPRAMLVSKYGARAWADFYNYPMDFSRAVFSTMKANLGGRWDQIYQDFLDSGAAGVTVQEHLSPRALEFRDPSTMSPAYRAAHKILFTPAEFATAIEQISKVMGIQRAMRFEGVTSGAELAKKVPEAVTEVRRFSGSPDFGRQGSIIEGYGLNLVYMFLNARLQGAISDIGRLLGRNGARRAAVTWGRLLGAIGTPTTILYLLNQQQGLKEDYDKRPQQEKNNYWLIPKSTFITNEQGEVIRDYWKIPKRESAKWTANMIESALKFGAERDLEGLRKFGQNLLEDISPVNIQGRSMQERAESTLSGLNPAFKIPIEWSTGRDLYRHRSLMSDQLKKASPEQQYTDRTPEAFKAISTAMPDVLPDMLRSPIMIENLVRNLTAGMVTQFLPASKPVKGRTGAENWALLQRFQAIPYTDHAAFTDAMDAMDREAADQQLARQRQATALLDANPGKTPGDFIPQGSDPRFVKEVIDGWVARQNGETADDRRLRALPTPQRAKYIAQMLEPLNAEQKAQAIETLAKKRILTSRVFVEMGLLLQQQQQTK